MIEYIYYYNNKRIKKLI
ncbi:hypothetical protein KK420_18000 [Clostridioides difficile]|nr:hypothetical protein [Clostridioides difficile]MBT2157896.1 hypothetical protein [Clostridioides difficile]